jgi:hypothetical protein
MLISIWWMVAAFVAGGICGITTLAVFSVMPREDEVNATVHTLNPTQ